MKVHPKVFANFKRFTQGKQKGEDIFHLLTPSDLNAHFKSFMEGLSAKVFRTYNASFTLQEELKKVKFRKDETVEEKVQGLCLIMHHFHFSFSFFRSFSPSL